MDEVRHVPLLINSLISCSVLDSKGYSFKGKIGAIYVYKGSKVILQGRRGTLYFLSGSTITGYVVVLENSSQQIDQPSIARDRARKVGVEPPKRYFEDMVNYALQVAKEVDPFEPSIYKEVVSCSEFAQWLAAIGDEMKSLDKKKT